MVETRRRRSITSSNPDRYNKALRALSPTHSHDTRKKERMHNFASMLGTIQAVSKFKLRRGSHDPDVEFDEDEQQADDAVLSDQEEGEYENVQGEIGSEGSLEAEQESGDEHEEVDGAGVESDKNENYDETNDVNSEEDNDSENEESSDIDDTSSTQKLDEELSECGNVDDMEDDPSSQGDASHRGDDSIVVLVKGIAFDLGSLAKETCSDWVSGAWMGAKRGTETIVTSVSHKLSMPDILAEIKLKTSNAVRSTKSFGNSYFVQPLKHDSLLDHVILVAAFVGVFWIGLIVTGHVGIDIPEPTNSTKPGGLSFDEQELLVRRIVKEEYITAMASVKSDSDKIKEQIHALEKAWKLHEQEVKLATEVAIENNKQTQSFLSSLEETIQESLEALSETKEEEASFSAVSQVEKLTTTINRLGDVETQVKEMLQTSALELENSITFREKILSSIDRNPQQQENVDVEGKLNSMSAQLSQLVQQVELVTEESELRIEQLTQQLYSYNTTEQLMKTTIENAQTVIMKGNEAIHKLEAHESDLEGSISNEIQGCEQEKIDVAIDKVVTQFSADRIGRADFALSAVGAIIEHGEPYTSPSYVPESTSLLDSIHELVHPFSHPPETVIEPDTTIGSCWACRLPDCKVTVKLVRPITIGAVSLDHISPLIAHDVRSAPRNFKVWGIPADGDLKHKVLLVESAYEVPMDAASATAGDEVQTFVVKQSVQKFDAVQLEVVSNHGFPEYTCIYRFRVHE